MRRQRLLLLVALWILPAHTLSAQEHPNLERGFKADKVYQFGDVDSVNPYNGNLTVRIPLGQEYRSNGGLAYGLTAVYNSTVWDYVTENYYDAAECDVSPQLNTWCGEDWVRSVPARRSNAGLGWMVSLGRLLSPLDPIVDPSVGGTFHWIYEDPNGADHLFSVSDSVDPNVKYTRDGSFLRLVPIAGGEYEVQFPDGMIHTFEPVAGSNSHRLKDIRDRFGNHVGVTYSGLQWTLTERDASNALVRTHYVRFQATSVSPWDPIPSSAPANYDTVITEVDLAAFGGTRATYEFEYSAQPGGAPGSEEVLYLGESPSPDLTRNPKVPRLRRIVLPDTPASTWEFEYDPTIAALSKVTLPTKGTIDWTYTSYSMPTGTCRVFLTPSVADPDDEPFATVHGVATRTVKAGPDTAAATWTYTHQAQESASFPCNGSLRPKPREAKVTIQSPDGLKTEQFFSIWIAGRDGAQQFDHSEYGLPFTRNADSGCDADPAADELCLSSREYDCSTGQCVLRRSNYVRYEGESRNPSLFVEDYGYRREAARRTIFHDDANRHLDVSRTGFDGLGHYRTVTTTDSWRQTPRTESTTYNATKAAVSVNPLTWQNTPANNRPSTGERWLLNSFTFTTTTVGGSTIKREFCFDATTGFLERRRDLAGNVRGTTDVLAAFEQAGGNIRAERYFGGDPAPLPEGFETCTAAEPAQPSFSLFHTYASGARSTTRHAETTFRSLDLTIDSNTGFPSTSTERRMTDASGSPVGGPYSGGLTTTYTYDEMGRIATIVPAGAAWTKYTYEPSAPVPTASVRQWARGAAETDPPLTESHHYYDGLGRLLQTRRLMPERAAGDRWAVTQMTYDPLGRRTTSSTPEYRWGSGYESYTPPGKTSWRYDPWGRTLAITDPDDKVTSFIHTGMRLISRTQTINVAETAVTTDEEYDGFGLLRSVTQSANGPAAQTTNYGYDAAGHLTCVGRVAGDSCSNNVADPQKRSFLYDGRGFLANETHPENGTTTYSYDALGHPTRKVTGAEQGPFDLAFDYDGAGRLSTVRSRNPYYPDQYRPLKDYEYGFANTAVDLANGQLKRATRHNYDPQLGDVQVAEEYMYGDDAGRLTTKTTTVLGEGSFPDPISRTYTQSYFYDDLDQVAALTYPQCVDTGFPVLPCGVNEAWNQIAFTRRQNLLTSIGGFASEITHHPTGSAASVVHQNGVTDGVAIDSAGRIAAISSTGALACTVPTLQPTGDDPPYGSSTTLHANAAGSPALSFQWFTDGDEPETYNAIPGATSSSYTTSAVTRETGYWIVAWNSCGRAQQRVVVAPFLATPFAVDATAVTSSHVSMSWSASSPADHFEVWRRADGMDALVASTSSTTFTDFGVSAGRVYLYWIRAADAGEGRSDPSDPDFASTLVLTPVTAGSAVRAADWTDLMEAIDAMRSVNGSPPVGWNEPHPGQEVLAAHLITLRTRMNEALGLLGLPISPYSDPTVDSTIPIRAIHLNELQQRVPQ